MARGWSGGRIPDWLEELLDRATDKGYETGDVERAAGEEPLLGEELREFAREELDAEIDNLHNSTLGGVKLLDYEEWLIDVFIEGYNEAFLDDSDVLPPDDDDDPDGYTDL